MNGLGARLAITRSNAARLALVALFSGAITIGFAPILVRLSQVGPSATAFWRVLLALPLLWLIMAVENQGPTPTRRPVSWPDYRALFIGGLFFTGDLAFWHWSINYTTVANATLLVNFAPVFVTLGSWLLFRYRVSGLFITGLVIALAGTTLLIGASFRLSPDYFLGDFLALIAAAFYAGYQLSVKYLRPRYSTATIMSWNGVAMCAILLPAALLSREILLPLDFRGWLVLLGLALLIHIGGQGLIAFALAHLPATFSSVTLLLQPVMAAIFAWLILTETLGSRQILGGLIVLVGIFLARRGSQVALPKRNA